MEKKVITSFTSMVTAEGENISVTYSLINEEGIKTIENERKTFILVDDEDIANVKALRDSLLKRV